MIGVFKSDLFYSLIKQKKPNMVETIKEIKFKLNKNKKIKKLLEYLLF